MDTFLEYLYCDVMKRYWSGSVSQQAALEAWEAAEGKDWDDLCDAAHLLAEEQGFSAFLAGFHLGFTLENTLRQQLGVVF